MSGVPRIQEQHRAHDVRADPRVTQDQHVYARSGYLAAQTAVAITEAHIETLREELAQARQEGEPRETCAAIHDALRAKERLHQARVLQAAALRAPYLEARRAHLAELGRARSHDTAQALRTSAAAKIYVRAAYTTWSAIADPSSGLDASAARRAQVEALCRPLLDAMEAYVADGNAPTIDDLVGDLDLIDPLPDETLDGKAEIRARWAPTNTTEEPPA